MSDTTRKYVEVWKTLPNDPTGAERLYELVCDDIRLSGVCLVISVGGVVTHMIRDWSYVEIDADRGELAPVLVLRGALRDARLALNQIANDPIGEPTATDREVLERCVEIARSTEHRIAKVLDGGGS